MWVSDQAKAICPMRCSFCWKSIATKALAPTPYTSMRRAATRASTTACSAATSRWAAVSSTARASAKAIFSTIAARSSPGPMSLPTTRTPLSARPDSVARVSRSCG
jgi:hypothetical protein